MSDEFDELVDPVLGLSAPLADRRTVAAQRLLAARLVSRLYRSAGASLRIDMLGCMLRPLSTLGVAAVAAGAFAQFLYRGQPVHGAAVVNDVARYSTDQVFELARFVQEVDSDTLRQLAGLLADNPMGAAALSASALILLYRRLRPLAPPGRAAAKLSLARARHRPPERRR